MRTPLHASNRTCVTPEVRFALRAAAADCRRNTRNGTQAYERALPLQRDWSLCRSFCCAELLTQLRDGTTQ